MEHRLTGATGAVGHQSPAISTVTSNLSPTSNMGSLRISANVAAASAQRRRVSWTVETVDNEGLGKKKSKCCCVYQKPRSWNESSSEDENEDEDCRNCRGHRKADYNSKRGEETKKERDSSEDLHHQHCDLSHSKPTEQKD